MRQVAVTKNKVVEKNLQGFLIQIESNWDHERARWTAVQSVKKLLANTDAIDGYVAEWDPELAPGHLRELPFGVILGTETPEMLLDEVYEILHGMECDANAAVNDIINELAKLMEHGLIIDNKGLGILINRDFIKKLFTGEFPPTIVSSLKDMVSIISGEYMVGSPLYSVPDASAILSSTTMLRLSKHPEWYALVFIEVEKHM